MGCKVVGYNPGIVRGRVILVLYCEESSDEKNALEGYVMLFARRIE